MSKDQGKTPLQVPADIELSDDDIFAAMKQLSGYLDITPQDFREVYHLAYRHAGERLLTALKARDLMTPEVAVVRPDTPLVEVATVMAARRVSGVPVVGEDGLVLGIISEKDFLVNLGSPGITSFMGLLAECLRTKKCQAIGGRAQKAEDLMTAPAVTVSEDASLVEIVRIFTARGINRVPVTDSQGRLRGIVSRGDLLKIGFPRPGTQA